LFVPSLVFLFVLFVYLSLFMFVCFFICIVDRTVIRLSLCAQAAQASSQAPAIFFSPLLHAESTTS
jgi:hypothetical protein